MAPRNRQFALLFTVNLLITLAYYMTFTTMAGYAASAFACSDALAGLAASSFMVASMLARPLCGRYADQVGLKAASVLAGALMAAGCLLYFASEAGFAVLLAARMLHGFSFGTANTTVPALVAKALGDGSYGSGTGRFMLSNTLGSALGPWAGLALSGTAGYASLFAACTVLAMATLALALLIRDGNGKKPDGASRPPVEPAVGTDPRPEPAKRRRSISPTALRMTSCLFLVGIAYSGVVSFLNGHSAEADLSDAAPFVFLLNAAALLFTRPAAGRLMDKRGENAVLYPSLVLGSVGFAVCALAQSIPGLLAVGPLMALGPGTAMSAGLGLVARYCRDDDATPGVSTFYLVCDAGAGLGPFLLGFLVSSIGYSNMFLTCAALSLAALAVYRFSHGRTHRARA